MKISQEIRSKIFGLYWSQNVGVYKQTTHTTYTSPVNPQRSNLLYLKLIPLSKITDEDLIKCYHLHSGIIGYDYTQDFKDVLTAAKHWIKKDGIGALMKYAVIVDFLRSRGYALPYMNYSVSDLVEAGVFKIKEVGNER